MSATTSRGATSIDAEAVKRATSVYLVDRVLPMLPERLSNGMCSLNPGVDRLTLTVEIDLDRTALVEGYRLYPSVIRSDQRLDYESVHRWLDSGEGCARRACCEMLRRVPASARAPQRAEDRPGRARLRVG